MSGEALEFEPQVLHPFGEARAALPAPSRAVGYAAAMGMVGIAVLLAFVAGHVSPGLNVTLVFVLPVVVAGASFGFGPSLAAAIAGVLAFDFFFTRPYLSFSIASSSDIWAAGLLLVIGAIVSVVAADARRKAVEARREAERAAALHELAHLVAEGADAAEVARATATALARMFHAPAVVLREQAGGLETAAASPGASLSGVDLEAAAWSLAHRQTSHADAYPFDASTFDFWPIRRRGAPGLVLGVGSGGADARPPHPAQYVELAGAYLAASLAGAGRGR
jgi:two-component system sensor histidine kinase KdpD